MQLPLPRAAEQSEVVEHDDHGAAFVADHTEREKAILSVFTHFVENWNPLKAKLAP